MEIQFNRDPSYVTILEFAEANGLQLVVDECLGKKGPVYSAHFKDVKVLTYWGPVKTDGEIIFGIAGTPEVAVYEYCEKLTARVISFGTKEIQCPAKFRFCNMKDILV